MAHINAHKVSCGKWVCGKEMLTQAFILGCRLRSAPLRLILLQENGLLYAAVCAPAAHQIAKYKIQSLS